MRAQLALGALCLAACASIAGLSDPKPAGGPDGTSCAHTPCDVEDNCGCTSAGTCSWNTDQGSAYCRTDDGTSALGQGCAQDTDCAQGTSCVFGECRTYCSGDPQCGATTCNADFTPSYPALVCADSCTPVSNAGCPGTSACLIIQGRGATFCLAGGTIPVGADCSQEPFSCVPGAVCHSESSMLLCRQECLMDGDCSTGTCMMSTDLTVRGTEYGVCM